MLSMETTLSRLETIIPTLATREDLTRLEAQIPTLATRADLASLEARIPSLATREDVACLEYRMMDSIRRVQMALHTEVNKLTWRIVTLLSGLLPAMIAATVYVVKFHS